MSRVLPVKVQLFKGAMLVHVAGHFDSCLRVLC